MYKKLLFTCLLILTGLCSFVQPTSQEIYLIINMKNEAVLPRNFRTVKDPFKTEAETLTREGLDGLNISGSAQFSKLSLDVILQTLNWKGPIYIVDLRHEWHGFLNDNAVTWFTHRNWGNIGESLQTIEEKEEQFIDQALKQKDIVYYNVLEKEMEGQSKPSVVPVPFTVVSGYTEKSLVTGLKVNYVRIPAIDHRKPSEENVKQFVRFVLSLPPNSWVHFHCSAGVGRTTTFMAMFDMIKNAKKLSFDQIIDRQAAIGGRDLKEVIETKKEKMWKQPYSQDRLDFLEKFYLFCKNSQNL